MEGGHGQSHAADGRGGSKSVGGSHSQVADQTAQLDRADVVDEAALVLRLFGRLGSLR